MDVVTLANQINARIKRLEELCKDIDDIGEEKANAIANYDVALAIAEAKLLRGVVSQVEGEELPDKIPATITKDIAKGLCKEERFKLENATNKYKGLLTKIEALEASLNAKQSINKHLSHEVR
jgi:hypothetical protein